MVPFCIRTPSQLKISHINTIEVTAAKTITLAESGSVFILKAAVGVQINLPSLTAGFNCRFITGLAFSANNWTIVSTTNVIQGVANVDGDSLPAVNENTISFSATAESLGDYVEIKCDGTNFYVSGSGMAAGSILFTAP